MAEAKKPTKKIIDVQHPGKTAPSGTSKSVIVTNRPIMKDPMVVDEEGKTEETASAPVYKSGGEAVIKPLGEQKAEEQGKVEDSDKDSKLDSKDDTATDKSKTISQLAEEADTKDEKKPADTPKTDENEKADEPEIKLPIGEDGTKDDTKVDAKKDDTAEKEEPAPDAAKANDTDKDDTSKSEPAEKPPIAAADTDSKSDLTKDTKEDPKEIEEAKEDKELKKRKAEVAKLSESKKYYLPITTVENRHNRRAVVIGVLISLLLIVAWINIALDAGLISLGGIKPFTNFF